MPIDLPDHMGTAPVYSTTHESYKSVFIFHSYFSLNGVGSLLEKGEFRKGIMVTVLIYRMALEENMYLLRS